MRYLWVVVDVTRAVLCKRGFTELGGDPDEFQYPAWFVHGANTHLTRYKKHGSSESEPEPVLFLAKFGRVPFSAEFPPVENRESSAIAPITAKAGYFFARDLRHARKGDGLV